MVADVASTTRLPPAAGRAASRRPRHLWQVPVFFLGLTALIATGVARPPWKPVDGRRAERDLAAARRLLDQPDAGRDPLLAAAERLPQHLERVPERAAEIHFLLGSCYLRLAGTGPAGETPETARQARRHLEEASNLGVPDGNRHRLTYRLGKAWHLTGGDPRAVIDHLIPSLDKGADDPFEGYGILAQAYLRLPTPDLEAALLANERQLQLHIDDDMRLAPVRLQRGELLLRLRKHDEARRVLANIGARAPAATQAQARFLRARSFQEEGHWEEAAALWKELLDDPRQGPREPGWVLYHLGVCRRQLEQPEEAARAWAECAARADGGDEGVAAALGLIDLCLAEGALASLETFERAVRDVKGPADWHNPLVGLEQARALFERGCAAFVEAGDPPRALKLARLYEKLAAPGAAVLLTAQAAHAAARTRQDDEARSLFRQAGEAYEQSAGQASRGTDRQERLWLSADCYRQGGQLTRLVAVLERALPAENDPKRLGEGWFRLAEAHRDLKHDAAARTACLKCIEYATPFAYRARHQLALLEIADGDIDEAVSGLELNLRLLCFDPDREAEEKSLYLLAHLLFQRRHYLMACGRLEQALRRFPHSPDAVRGRFELAECQLMLAAQDVENLRLQEPSDRKAQAHFEGQYYRRLGLAAQTYQELIDILTKRPSERLTPEEQAYLRQALFAAAKARSNLGHYQDALVIYRQLAERYARRVEELHALHGVAQCHWRQRDSAQAQDTLVRLRSALQQLDDTAFAAETWKRQDWEKWLAEVSRQ